MQSVEAKEFYVVNIANEELENKVAACQASSEESVKQVTEGSETRNDGTSSDEELHHVSETDENSKHSKDLTNIPSLNFTIGEYTSNVSNNELSPGDQPLIRNSTIEELKLKLEKKEISFRPRQTPPRSPTTPTNPTNRNFGEDQENMIPETRTPPLLTDDGLIAPRKPINPVREDPGRQNLHRELLFNQKIGKSVLNQKSELQRALEKHKDNIAKKQLEHHIAEKTPELEKVIADRARRLENTPKKEIEEDKVINKEFLQARMKLKSTSDSK